jgi:hypothetical protein
MLHLGFKGLKNGFTNEAVSEGAIKRTSKRACLSSYKWFSF